MSLLLRDLPVAEQVGLDLRLTSMTVAEAFRQTLDALMKAHHMRGVDLTATTSLSSATVTKLRNGERGASFEVLEMLRSAFGVQAKDLFDPDAALAQIGLSRVNPAVSESRREINTLVSGADSPAHLSDSTTLKESDVPDGALFQKVRAYWMAMEPAQHAQLVRVAWELSNPAGERAAVGFKRG